MRNVLRVTTGIGLVLLGITGLIMPIMPGWIFLVPGLVILSEYFPPLKRLLGWARARLAAELGKRTRRTPEPER